MEVVTDITLTEINIYPVKSLAGIRVTSAKVLPKGLEYDRRYMLCDNDGIAMTQREYPIMSLFKTAFVSSGIQITFQGESITIPYQASTAEREIQAEVWSQKVRALEVNSSWSTWFSERINIPCRLLFFPEANERPVDSKYQINDEHVSLADAYPILIIGQSSLNDLNRRLQTPVPMNRFRPNLVFTGGDAFYEDQWRTFTIGESNFAAVKPCARCVLTTVDQETGKKGAEPLRTLAKYRTESNKVLFGQNVLVLTAGSSIRTGDRITVETLASASISPSA